MKFLFKLSAISVIVVVFVGCVGVTAYSTRPVEVHVSDRTTGKPVPDALVSIAYVNRSVPPYLVNIPDGASGRTDVSGVVRLPMADFSREIIFLIDWKAFGVDRTLVRHGGFLRPCDSGTQPQPDSLIVQLIPKK